MNRNNSVSTGIRIVNIGLVLGLAVAAVGLGWSVFVEPDSVLTRDGFLEGPDTVRVDSEKKEQGALLSLMSSSSAVSQQTQSQSGVGRLRLCGLAKGMTRSWAVLEETQSRNQIIASIGDRVFGYELKRIEESRVVLLKNGVETELLIRSAPLKKTGSQNVSTPKAGGNELNTVKKSQNSWDVEREKIDLAFSDLASIRKTARIIPFYRSGTAEGFLVFDIKPESPLLQIGLKNGDIVTHINGSLLTAKIGPAELFSMLSSRDNVNLLVNRNSSTVNLCYRIR